MQERGRGAALFLFAVWSACAPAAQSGPPRIELNTGSERATIDVVGLSRNELGALDRDRSRDEWTTILHVSVAADQPPMLGDYRIADSRMRFTPMFPLDPGRAYHVTLHGARRSGADDRDGGAACPRSDADHGGVARVSERRYGAREPTAPLHSFLGADGS